jgi:predicted DNA-binding transcriptional regulator
VVVLAIGGIVAVRMVFFAIRAAVTGVSGMGWGWAVVEHVSAMKVRSIEREIVIAQGRVLCGSGVLLGAGLVKSECTFGGAAIC